MPWYKLPHTTLAMWFDQKMPNLKPARKPRVKRAPKPKSAPPATGGVFRGPGSGIGLPAGVIHETVIPNAPKPKEETKAE